MTDARARVEALVTEWEDSPVGARGLVDMILAYGAERAKTADVDWVLILRQTYSWADVQNLVAAVRARREGPQV